MPNIYRVNTPPDDFNRTSEKSASHSKTKKKKKDFKTLKNNTVKSLNDVEYFLNNWGQFVRYAKFYKLFKKR